MSSKIFLLLIILCINVFAEVSFNQEVLYGKIINSSQQIVYTVQDNQGYLNLIENEQVIYKIKLNGVVAFKVIKDTLFSLTYNKLNGFFLEQYKIKNKIIHIEKVVNRFFICLN